MAPKNKNVSIEEEGISGSRSNDILSSLLKENKDDIYNHIIPRHQIISTGSLTLDSYVKIRSGGVVRLVGKGAELGKTSECFVIARNYMDVMPKSKTLFIKAESRLSEEMQKRSGHKFVTNPEDWDYGTVFILSTNTFETIAKVVKKLLEEMHENGEYLVIILDSLDGVILKTDLHTKEVDNTGMVAGVPKMTKLLFRHLGLPISHYDALLLITGQYSASIELDKYSTEAKRQGPSVGGASVEHQSDYVLSYGQRFTGDQILEKPDEKPDHLKNKIIGVYATVEIKKSATDVSGLKIKIPIRKNKIGNAIWVSKEVADNILSWSFATRKGAWINFSPEIIQESEAAGIKLQETIQGLNNLYEYIENDKVVFEWFYNKFKNLLCE
jgi:hypothetical protein